MSIGTCHGPATAPVIPFVYGLRVLSPRLVKWLQIGDFRFAAVFVLEPRGHQKGVKANDGCDGRRVKEAVLWVRRAVFAAGDPTELGFVGDSSLLLVASHSGRGRFDCELGKRVAPDASEWTDRRFPTSGPAAIGFGVAGEN